MVAILRKIVDKLRGRSGLVLFDSDADLPPKIGFLTRINLRLWLLRKRAQWLILKMFRRF
jgi:hypothetical protein